MYFIEENQQQQYFVIETQLYDQYLDKKVTSIKDHSKNYLENCYFFLINLPNIEVNIPFFQLSKDIHLLFVSISEKIELQLSADIKINLVNIPLSISQQGLTKKYQIRYKGIGNYRTHFLIQTEQLTSFLEEFHPQIISFHNKTIFEEISKNNRNDSFEITEYDECYFILQNERYLHSYEKILSLDQAQDLLNQYQQLTAFGKNHFNIESYKLIEVDNVHYLQVIEEIQHEDKSNHLDGFAYSNCDLNIKYKKLNTFMELFINMKSQSFGKSIHINDFIITLHSIKLLNPLSLKKRQIGEYDYFKIIFWIIDLLPLGQTQSKRENEIETLRQKYLISRKDFIFKTKYFRANNLEDLFRFFFQKFIQVSLFEKSAKYLSINKNWLIFVEINKNEIPFNLLYLDQVSIRLSKFKYEEVASIFQRLRENKYLKCLKVKGVSDNTLDLFQGIQPNTIKITYKFYKLKFYQEIGSSQYNVRIGINYKKVYSKNIKHYEQQSKQYDYYLQFFREYIRIKQLTKEYQLNEISLVLDHQFIESSQLHNQILNDLILLDEQGQNVNYETIPQIQDQNSNLQELIKQFQLPKINSFQVRKVELAYENLEMNTLKKQKQKECSLSLLQSEFDSLPKQVKQQILSIIKKLKLICNVTILENNNLLIEFEDPLDQEIGKFVVQVQVNNYRLNILSIKCRSQKKLECQQQAILDQSLLNKWLGLEYQTNLMKFLIGSDYKPLCSEYDYNQLTCSACTYQQNYIQTLYLGITICPNCTKSNQFGQSLNFSNMKYLRNLTLEFQNYDCLNLNCLNQLKKELEQIPHLCELIIKGDNLQKFKQKLLFNHLKKIKRLIKFSF